VNWERARPPIFSGDEFICFPLSRVAYSRVIIVHLKEVAAEGVIFWNINMASVKDDAIFQVSIIWPFDEGARAIV
jgi:hypothetical protein